MESAQIEGMSSNLSWGRGVMGAREKKRLDELHENGQIPVVEMEGGQLKLIRQDKINLFGEDRG